MAGRELEELSLPSASEPHYVPAYRIKLAVTSLARVVIRIGTQCKLLKKSPTETFSERVTEDMLASCICTAINHPDVATNDMQVKMATKVLTWVTKRYSLTIATHCSNMLKYYGRMIIVLISGIVLNYISSNMCMFINSQIEDKVTDSITDKVRAALYLSCWIPEGRYNIDSTVECADVIQWIDAGRLSAIADGVPVDDIGEVHDLIMQEMRRLTDSHIKISAFMLLIQRVGTKYKMMAIEQMTLPPFNNAITEMINVERAVYNMGSVESFDPSCAWKSLKDKMEEYYRQGKDTGNSRTQNLINTDTMAGQLTALQQLQLQQQQQLLNAAQQATVQDPLTKLLLQVQANQNPALASQLQTSLLTAQQGNLLGNDNALFALKLQAQQNQLAGLGLQGTGTQQLTTALGNGLTGTAGLGLGNGLTGTAGLGLGNNLTGLGLGNGLTGTAGLGLGNGLTGTAGFGLGNGLTGTAGLGLGLGTQQNAQTQALLNTLGGKSLLTPGLGIRGNGLYNNF